MRHRLGYYFSEENFMPGAEGEGEGGYMGSRERACEGARARGGNRGQQRRPILGGQNLHGSSV